MKIIFISPKLSGDLIFVNQIKNPIKKMLNSITEESTKPWNKGPPFTYIRTFIGDKNEDNYDI